jgi:hypothetical protein
MIIRKIALLATIAALSPVISNASPETASVKACASAFAASLASPGASAPSFRLDYRSTNSGSAFTDIFTSHSTFALAAHDPKTGAVIARASCSTDERGNVTAIAATPLNAETSSLASKL